MPSLSERAADAEIGVDAVEGPVAHRALALPGGGRLRGVELDDAGGRVATEQRALRPLEHFDLRDIERRVRFHHDMLFDDIVHDDLDRLRGAEIEIDIAEPADVEAREDSARRGFGIEAGHLARQRQQRVATGRGIVIELVRV